MYKVTHDVCHFNSLFSFNFSNFQSVFFFVKILYLLVINDDFFIGF
jgi:hypothetical protein